MSGRILVGTCSWADKTLIDSGWYPPEAKKPEDRLRFYSEQFPVVEVDSTYYAIPQERNPEAWVERTPPEFVCSGEGPAGGAAGGGAGEDELLLQGPAAGDRR